MSIHQDELSGPRCLMDSSILFRRISPLSRSRLQSMMPAIPHMVKFRPMTRATSECKEILYRCLEADIALRPGCSGPLESRLTMHDATLPKSIQINA